MIEHNFVLLLCFKKLMIAELKNKHQVKLIHKNRWLLTIDVIVNRYSVLISLPE